MNVRQQLLEAKKAYKAKNYQRSYELYSEIYSPQFDNSSKYSYAWAIYQAKVKNYESEEDLLEDAELITTLTRQNDLNRSQFCVYTMAVFKVIKLLYENQDYENLPHWLNKINPDLLDEVRFTRDGHVYPSNKEHYYLYASKTYLELKEYEKCVNVSRRALNTMTRFTANNAMWLQWRIAKSLRQLEDYRGSLKYLFEVKKIQKDWYVEKEIAENYFFLEMYDFSLEYALKSALNMGPTDAKFNLYTLLYDLLIHSHPDYAQKHEELVEMIRTGDDEGKRELENELVDIWKELSEEYE